MCVHLLRFEVNLIVTWEGSKGLIKALDSRGGEPSEPITMRTGGGDISLSVKNLLPFIKKKHNFFLNKHCCFKTL